MQSEDARDRDGLAAAPLETLADLLKTPDLAIAEMAARLLALLCETTEQVLYGTPLCINMFNLPVSKHLPSAVTQCALI